MHAIGRGDHPRVCGEKSNFKITNLTKKGITPACAGKRFPAQLGPSAHQDHPRVCGEKTALQPTIDNLVGSPPRVRGKAISLPVSVVVVGITPACAGKSSCRDDIACVGRDHPRVCGEKMAGDGDLTAETGSPPRVRGKVPPITKRLLLFRITPACAGKRDSSRPCAGRIQDHPRVCGEKPPEPQPPER